MNKYNVRCGDWAVDPRAYNYPMRLDVEAIACADMFVPIPVTSSFFVENDFKREEIDGVAYYHRSKGDEFVTLSKVADNKWRITAKKGEEYLYNGFVFSVHEIQHILIDCTIYWEIKVK